MIPPESRTTAPGYILVADDNKVSRQMLALHVTQLGHHVTAADNGRQALALLREEPFDLVLLDVLMPEMDGVAALEQIKADERLRGIPVVMVSGLDEVESVVRCIEEGAEDYLTKPFDPIVLRARIGACLEKKRLRDAERRRAEELERALRELKAAQDRLVAHQKLASLGALTAGIAHEIRNPLNFVTNFAQLAGELVRELRPLVDRLAGGEREALGEVHALLADLEQNVARIEEHGRRADGTVRSMLLHARARPGERQRTDVNALVAEAARLAYHALRGQDSTFHVTLDVDLDPAVPPLEVFAQDLSRVVLNLTQNACQAAHEKQHSAGAGYAPRVAVRTRDVGAAVELRVWDNGPGLSEAVRQKLFTPFFTTKPPGSGTGLGLSISYDVVVQMHKGSLRAESVEGQYAEFIVSLPKDLPPVDEGRPRPDNL